MPAHFSEDEQAQIYESLMAAGLAIAREAGLRKLTVARAARRAGIATGSFYSFYRSKEEFVVELIEESARVMDHRFAEALAGRPCMSPEEFLGFLGECISADFDILSSLGIDDLMWLRDHLADASCFSTSRQRARVEAWLARVAGVGDSVDAGVLLNLIKLVYVVRENGAMLDEGSADSTRAVLMRAIGACLSGELAVDSSPVAEACR